MLSYSTDILTLSPDHLWTLDGSFTDIVGAVTITNTGGITSEAGLCVGSVNCYSTNGISSDRLTVPSTTDINNSTTTAKGFGGWFNTSKIQPHLCRIYGEGNTTVTFQFILAFGNNTMLEVTDADGTAQVFGISLEPNRNYHIFGTTIDGVIELFIDGISTGTSTGHGVSLSPRTTSEFGDPVGTVGIGSSNVLLQSAVNGRYNYWASWNGPGTVPSATQIRETLFELGCIPEIIITSQAQLDSIQNSSLVNAALNIQVQGSGILNLSANNIIFNDLSSVHVQYTGTGTLNWTNINGSNCSIVSAPNGTINIINPRVLTLEGILTQSEIRIYDNEINDYGNFNTELAGIESSSNTFSYNHTGSVNSVIIQIMKSGYKEIKIQYDLTNSSEVLQIFYEQENN